jgi:hypothetical protein
VAIKDSKILLEEGNRDAAPDAAEAMHLGCLKRIVDLKRRHHPRAEAVYE